MNARDIPEELERFLEITRIPRPSGHLDAIRGYLARFAESHALEHRTDAAGNVVIRRPGKGVCVTLQAHMDMVPAAVSSFDFETTPVSASVSDGWVSAEGTTLGADDGAGIAIALCALADPDLEGCDVECLFTADEETGLDGARGLEPGSLEGRYLINIDSEDAGEITVGCAGSSTMRAAFSRPVSEPSGFTYRVEIAGLLGGHSAGDIDKGRTNALLVLVDLLSRVPCVRLGLLEGGDAPNSIPSHAAAVFSVPFGVNVYETTEPFFDDLLESISRMEPEAAVAFGRAQPLPCWSEEDTAAFLKMMKGIRSGVLSRDGDAVRTSSSIGLASMEGGECRFAVMPRSSDASELDAAIAGLLGHLEAGGAEAEASPASPPWTEDAGGELIEKAVRIHREVFGTEPRVCVTHGGLECGIIRNLNPSLEGAISVGPTILGAHSPSERMDVSTLSSVKEYVFELVVALSAPANRL